MIKIDGKKIAQEILDELKELPAPGKKLAAILAGDNQASLVFIGVKRKLAEELGVEFELRCLDAAVSQKQLEKEIEAISGRKDIGGVIVQLPLPKGLNRDAALRRLNSQKDVDNLTGRAPVEAPAVSVVKDILKEVNFDLRGKTVAVVGRGFLVGQPIFDWLAKFQIPNSKFQIKIADIDTKNLKKFLADADLIISGVGKKDLINPEWLKTGVGVIDFGYPPDLISNFIPIPSPDGYRDQIPNLAFYTPTPGGTGPILVAELFRNFYKLNG